MRTTREHFLFARERAMELLADGNAGQAVASLISDLQAEEGTRPIVAEQAILSLAMGELIRGGVEGVRRFIEGLPVPPEEKEGPVEQR